MTERWVTVLVVSALFLAGCGSKGDTTSSSPSTTPTTSGPVVNVTVGVTKAPTGGNVSQAFQVDWRVAVNGTTAKLNQTGLVWGNASVAVPTHPRNFPFGASNQTNVSPGTYTGSITVNWAGTIFLRPFVNLTGRYYFGAERAVQVIAEPVGQTWTFSIVGALGPASYDDDDALVKVNDLVKWTNDDNANLPHTATSDSGSSFAFDTASIAAGATSGAIKFTKAGTFAYHCDIHSTMTGSITVSA